MKLFLNSSNNLVMGFYANNQNVSHLYPDSIEKIVPDKTIVKEDGTYEIPELSLSDKRIFEKESISFVIDSKISAYSGKSVDERLDKIIEAIDLTRKEAKNSASEIETIDLNNFKKIKDYIKQLRILQKSLETSIDDSTTVEAVDSIVNSIVWPNLPNI